MTYWLQELQQKRWEHCNGLDMAQWGSRTPPAPGDVAKGLVARDSAGESGGARARASPLRTAGQPAGQVRVESVAVVPCGRRLSAVTERVQVHDHV